MKSAVEYCLLDKSERSQTRVIFPAILLIEV